MTNQKTEADGKHPQGHRGVFSAMGMALAFVCVVGASKAVNQALHHTNLDMLLLAIRDGFVPWMLVSYGLVGVAAGLVVWSSGRYQRRHLRDLMSDSAKESEEPIPATDAAPPDTPSSPPSIQRD